MPGADMPGALIHDALMPGAITAPIRLNSSEWCETCLQLRHVDLVADSYADNGCDPLKENRFRLRPISV
jgi:hypothetical protein